MLKLRLKVLFVDESELLLTQSITELGYLKSETLQLNKSNLLLGSVFQRGAEYINKKEDEDNIQLYIMLVQLKSLPECAKSREIIQSYAQSI